MKRTTTKADKKEPKLVDVKAELVRATSTISWLDYQLRQKDLEVNELEDRVSYLMGENQRLFEEKASLLSESWWVCTVRKINECWVAFVK